MYGPSDTSLPITKYVTYILAVYLNFWAVLNIQIKIAMSKDKLRILIKILVESHMAFDWEIKCAEEVD